MRHRTVAVAIVVVGVALLGACGLEPEDTLGETSEALSGTFHSRPTITSINPTAAAPGTTVTIRGGGFDMLVRGPAAFGSTTINAARASVTYVSPTELRVVVPAGAVQGPIYLLGPTSPTGGAPTVQLTSPQIFTPLVAPAAPANLTATVVSSSRIDLAWADRSWNEDNFDVWMLDANGWRSVRLLGANVTSAAITGLQPSTTYSFRVRAQNATGSSAFSNTVTATTPAAIGTLVLTNNSQVSISEVTFDGVPIAPTRVAGNQSTYTLAEGAYNVVATLSLANGDWVCSLGGATTVTANQTTNVSVDPLTAGQILTHCWGSVDYIQGSFVDSAGFHTVSARVHADGTFEWWLDGARQAPETITGTSFSEPWLTFTLSSGDTVRMSVPFGSMQLSVNRFAVQMTRASGW